MRSHCYRHNKHGRDVRSSVALYCECPSPLEEVKAEIQVPLGKMLEICPQMLEGDGCLPAERLELSLHCQNNCLFISNSTVLPPPVK